LSVEIREEHSGLWSMSFLLQQEENSRANWQMMDKTQISQSLDPIRYFHDGASKLNIEIV
jgi:hypothetical protein